MRRILPLIFIALIFLAGIGLVVYPMVSNTLYERDQSTVLAEYDETVAQAEQYVERRLSALQTTPPRRRKTFIMKDVRLFLNSLDRGLRLVRQAGVDAQAERRDTEDAILLTIRIPRQPPKGS